MVLILLIIAAAALWLGTVFAVSVFFHPLGGMVAGIILLDIARRGLSE